MADNKYEIVSVGETCDNFGGKYATVEEAVDAVRKWLGLYRDGLSVRYDNDPFGNSCATLSALGKTFCVRSVDAVRMQNEQKVAVRESRIADRHKDIMTKRIRCYKVVKVDDGGQIVNITDSVVHCVDDCVSDECSYVGFYSLGVAKLFLTSYAPLFYAFRGASSSDGIVADIEGSLLAKIDILSDGQCKSPDGETYRIEESFVEISFDDDEDIAVGGDSTARLYYSLRDVRITEKLLSRFRSGLKMA